MNLVSFFVAFLFLRHFSHGFDESLSDTNKTWWMTGVFYQIYPRSFMDSDGDGVGDLRGITNKLDYFSFLGIDGVWLSPIFESPMKDFGYDIKNYTDIDPLFGTLEDFKGLTQTAKTKGLHVVLDFVPNHSSDQHPWFEKSRRREEPYADYYVWVDGKKNGTEPPNNWMSMFGGSAWEWDPLRGQFYYHQFLKEQPDLNFRNPLVIEELGNVLRYWMDLGVSGFRIDAMKHLFEDSQLRDEPPSNDPTAQPDEYNSLSHIYTTSLPEVLDVLGQWRHVTDEYEARDGFHRVLMIEINETIPKTVAYYGNESHPLADLPFNFELFKISNRSTARDVHKLVSDWLNGIPESKWPNWIIGNHDQHRIANRSHVDLIDGFNMINLLLKGTPVVYYGEEIGMTDTHVSWDQTRDPFGLSFGPDRYTKFSRDPERTPMQWTGQRFAGFTSGNATWLPINPNYKDVNVESEKQEVNSHLNIFKKLVKVRQEPSILRGQLFYPIVTDTIFSFAQVLKGSPGFVTLVNFGNEDEILTLDEGTEQVRFPSNATVEVLSSNHRPHVSDSPTVDLRSFALGPKQAAVLKFSPIWV